MKRLRQFLFPAVILSLLLCLVPGALALYDVAEDSPFVPAIAYVVDNGYMDKTGENAFLPSAMVQRREVVESIWRLAGRPEAESAADFTDVPRDDPNRAAVDWAAEAGVVEGGEDGKLRPGAYITRQQFAAILWRWAGSPEAGRARSFADRGDIADYAQTAARWARANGYINGTADNRFLPWNPLTRAQLAQILCNYLLNNGVDAPGIPAPEETLPLSGKIICLDPGHCVTPLTGKGYTGPVSPLSDEQKPLYTTGTSGKNMTEEKLNLIVGLKLRDALEELGAEVLMTREVSEITITGIERCELANKNNADVNIHIHADGNDNKTVHGVSVMTPTGKLLGTPSIEAESTRLGRLMVDAVAEATGAKNRGIMPRSDMSGFNFSEVPSVLIEMGFMSNPEEDAKLESDAYQDLIVQGMVTSLLRWFGLE